MRGRRIAAAQDEGLERLQVGVQAVDFLLQALDLGRLDAQRRILRVLDLGRAEVRAQVEEVVLHPLQHLVVVALAVQARQAQDGVGLVHRAVGGDAQVVLGAPLAGAERGLSLVAAARVDAGELNHRKALSFRGCCFRGVTCRSGAPGPAAPASRPAR